MFCYFLALLFFLIAGWGGGNRWNGGATMRIWGEEIESMYVGRMGGWSMIKLETCALYQLSSSKLNLLSNCIQLSYPIIDLSRNMSSLSIKPLLLVFISIHAYVLCTYLAYSKETSHLHEHDWDIWVVFPIATSKLHRISPHHGHPS